MFGSRIDDGRDHHAGDRADRRSQAPAQRQHPADADADQAAESGFCAAARIASPSGV